MYQLVIITLIMTFCVGHQVPQSQSLQKTVESDREVKIMKIHEKNVDLGKKEIKDFPVFNVDDEDDIDIDDIDDDGDGDGDGEDDSEDDVIIVNRNSITDSSTSTSDSFPTSSILMESKITTTTTIPETTIAMTKLVFDTESRTNSSTLSTFSQAKSDILTNSSKSSRNIHTITQPKARVINSMNLNPTNPSVLVKGYEERKQLMKSDGPILNYIFNSHSNSQPYNKHHHHDLRYGPHFETDNVTNITVQAGNSLYLSCRISLLQDKTVSWVRRKHGETNLDLLTVGKQTYSGDPRYTIEFQYPNNWRLKIARANKYDEGIYECQISTHPPRVITYNLHINAPEVTIIDEQGLPLLDKSYEVDSTIKLTCIVRHQSMLTSAVYWRHNDNILNHDVIRGGISVKTSLMNYGANSTLFVAKVNKSDSGNYTCAIGPNQCYTVTVHVLNESLAELHHSNSSLQPGYHLHLLLALLGLLVYLPIQILLR